MPETEPSTTTEDPVAPGEPAETDGPAVTDAPAGTEDAAPEAGPDGGLEHAVAGFTAALARQQDLADRREEIITRLHTELQELRRGELDTALDLVRHGLIRLYDRILRQAEQIDAPLDTGELRTLLRALADEAADTLAGTGTERYAPREGEPFDAARHRPVGRAEAVSQEADRTVARVAAAGFARGERVVRKAEVVVARWVPPGGAPPAAEQ
ncbi:nucleotide exchange factor GrpE [Streptomyces sp. HD1123-B1]|uniref:nucleotide exchange factor GrpE n=1 Tax=Streptomyces huangiella TaxID=3228804 RepID=UPI003D7EF86D